MSERPFVWAGQASLYRGLMQDDLALQASGTLLITRWTDGFWKTNGDSRFARAYR